MIYGEGFIAKAFKKYKNNNSLIFFASGVSNSLEIKLSRYNKEINLLINSSDYKIKQIPSWYFDEIKKESQDLITATRCLNEINNAGIIYFIVEANRTLKKNGYLYIRDSNKRKSGRNIVNYDEIFEKILGYKVIKKFQLQNRKDIYAIPRLYQKKVNKNYEFTELFNKIIGFEAVTSHGSIYDQNLKTK